MANIYRQIADELGVRDQQVEATVALLDGARAILVERFAEDADLIGALREEMRSNGLMASTVR